MPHSSGRQLKRLVAVSFVSVALMLSPNAAFASTTTEDPDEIVTESDSVFPEFSFPESDADPFVPQDAFEYTYIPKPDPNQFSTTALNPLKCGGKTDKVHRSGGTSSGQRMSSLHTRIINCNRKIDTLVNGAEIMKKGWFGLWHRSAFVAKTVKGKYQVETIAKAVCGNFTAQTYRGNGYHRITHKGTNYIARTSSASETRMYCDS